MNHTQGQWKYSHFGVIQLGNDPKKTDTYIIEGEGAHTVAIVPCYAPTGSGIANARLIAAAPVMLGACKELADIFPEQSMSEMDAADFKDRAHRIWAAAETAKNTIAKTQND